MNWPQTPYDEDPKDAAFLKRANLFYEVPILAAISHALNEMWNERNPEWKTTGRRVPPYMQGDYRRAVEAVQELCKRGGHPLPPIPDALQLQ